MAVLGRCRRKQGELGVATYRITAANLRVRANLGWAILPNTAATC
jgi:hypothetical protein